MRRWLTVGAVCLLAPLGMGARGCGAVNSMTPAPSVDGRWAVTYDEGYEVRVKLGGAFYDATLPSEGGMVEVEHDGVAFQFMVDCSHPAIVCPNEVFPAEVTASQREPAYPHRMWVSVPRQSCSGQTVPADPAECGEGTLNPDCEDVCDGDVIVSERDAFGVIDEPGESFDLLLGGGVASNGLNCVLLGVSSAHADISSTGSAESGDWTATSFDDGRIVTAYGGGCLWANVSEDEELEAVALSATFRITTGFRAVRAD